MNIKPQKPKPVPKRRQTLAGQIRRLSQTDSASAKDLARLGRQFSKIETFLADYYSFTKICPFFRPGDECPFKSESLKEIVAGFRRIFERKRERLCAAFMRAVDAEDPQKIIETADAVKFIKTFKPSGDNLRYDLLVWKDELKKTGEQWTIRKIAKSFGWPDKGNADGFSRLSRNDSA